MVLFGVVVGIVVIVGFVFSGIMKVIVGVEWVFIIIFILMVFGMIVFLFFLLNNVLRKDILRM